MSDHKGARLILDALPPAKLLLADRGYDSNWFRDALARKGCKPCIPSTKSRKIPLPYDKTLYKQRHKIEIMFSRLKDWWRIGAVLLVFSDALPIEKSFGLSFANTFNVFGFRKDFFDSHYIENLPAALKILAAIQTILGTILLFLVGLGIRNKFRMK
jgi:Transposase DDE domain